MICGIKFVSVPVRDEEKALAFWIEKAGFKVAIDQAFGPQRWIEWMIPARTKAWCCSRWKVMKRASAQRSRCRCGAMTYSPRVRF